MIPEFCNLTGLKTIKDKNKFREIINKIQVGPNVRYQRLMQFVSLINSKLSIRNRFNSWGITVEPNFFSTTATLLNEEEVFNSMNKSVGYRKSTKTMRNWSSIFKDSILMPVNISSWFIVFYRNNQPHVNNFVSTFRRLSHTMTDGFTMPRMIMIDNSNVNTYLHAIKQNYQPEDQFVVIMTPDSFEVKSRYDAIKQLCTVQLGIASQFIRISTMNSQKFQSICPNIIVQITCKLGGYPWAVSMPMNGAMFIGVDIYHKTQIRKESVLAFVASLNNTASQWYSRCFIKKDTSDMANGNHLYEATAQALIKYHYKNGTLPKYILIYRDDVGTSPENLCNVEFNPMMGAIQHVYNKTSNNITIPHVTFMTVAKRITTKIFKKDSSRCDSEISIDNASSGTILDIDDGNISRFFLVSQKMVKSTACPVRISVLRNTTDEVTIEMLQLVSYKLTYLYYNTAMISRQPAPGMVKKFLF